MDCVSCMSSSVAMPVQSTRREQSDQKKRPLRRARWRARATCDLAHDELVHLVLLVLVARSEIELLQ